MSTRRVDRGWLLGLLRKKFPEPAYALFTEVRNQTGYGPVSRSADAVAMSLWPSRGLLLYGFELKHTRDDWLRELKKPAKADVIASYCDRWALVASSSEVFRVDEVPPKWGIYVPANQKTDKGAEPEKLKKTWLVCIREPQAMRPKPLDRKFLAAILRRASEGTLHRSEIAEELEEANKKGHESGMSQEKWRHDDVTRKLTELQQQVRSFEAASGVSISGVWQYDNLGKAVRFIVDGGLERQRGDLQRLRETAARVERAVGEQLDRLNAEERPQPQVSMPECGA